MPRQDLGSTPALQCGHCGNRAPLEVRARDSRVTTHEAPDMPGVAPWDAGTVYEVLACPACDGVSFARYEYHEVWMEEGVEYRMLYPADRVAPAGLPGPVAEAYAAARRARHLDPNAFGTATRGLLERVCADRGATGDKLHQQITDLVKRGDLPANLVGVAGAVRLLGNVGAHGGAAGLGAKDVALLDGLVRLVLEYVYSAPELTRQAEARLRELGRPGA